MTTTKENRPGDHLTGSPTDSTSRSVPPQHPPAVWTQRRFDASAPTRGADPEHVRPSAGLHITAGSPAETFLHAYQLGHASGFDAGFTAALRLIWSSLRGDELVPVPTWKLGHPPPAEWTVPVTAPEPDR